MTNYNLYNVSTVVNNINLQNMTKAINNFLITFCNDWGLSPIQLVIGNYNNHIPIPNNSIFMMDDSDAGDGVLGYHYEDSGKAIAKVFARTTLNLGGVLLYKDKFTFTVAQVLSHEVLELVGNSFVDKYCLANDGLLYAMEMCDAVESNLLMVTIPGGIKIGLTDYLMPVWFSADSIGARYNKTGTLTAPFTIDSGGYSIIINIIDGYIDTIYGATHPSGTASLVSVTSKDIANDVKELAEKLKLKIKPKS